MFSKASNMTKTMSSLISTLFCAAACSLSLGLTTAPPVILSDPSVDGGSVVVAVREVTPEAAVNCKPDTWRVRQFEPTPGLLVSALGTSGPTGGGTLTCILMYKFDTGLYVYDGTVGQQGQDAVVIGLRSSA
jgi:hypothetical protein